MNELEKNQSGEFQNDSLSEFDASNSPNSKRKKTLIILGVLFVVALLLVFVFAIKPKWDLNKAIEISSENFNLAQDYESEFDYEKAIEYYGRVIEEDEDNYEDAQERIAQLNKEAEDNKFVAKALVALKNQNIISTLDDVSQIGVGTISSYGLSITCRINGYGYIISESRIDSSLNDIGLGTYVSVYYDRLTNLYIMEFMALFYDNGWLSYSTNQLRQEACEYQFQMFELSTKKELVIGDLVNYYFDLYYKNENMTIFE